MTNERRGEELLSAALGELRAALPESADRSARARGRPSLLTTRERFWPIPIYVERGDGAYLEDVDGRRYVDCNMGHGPLILGHCHPAVVSAIVEQLRRGNHYGPPSVHETALAELIVENVPGAERVAFTNSGSEADMAAVRIARAATGRQKVAKCEGGLHGSYDPLRHSVLSFAGSSRHPVPSPDYGGIPPEISDSVVVFSFDEDLAVEAIRAEGDQLACVIVEPLQGSAGALPASSGFLEGVRKACDEVGAVLILDEVITGFRLGRSSGAGAFGVTADLTVLGKAIGGGLPVGAVCGRADLIDRTASPPGRQGNEAVFVGGTFSGNPLTAVAGHAQLSHLLEGDRDYRQLDTLGDKMRQGLVALLASLGIAAHVTGAGSIWGGPYFVDEPPTDIRTVATGDQLAARLLSIYLLLAGVLVTSPSHLNFVSTAHTEADVETVVEAHRFALERLQAEGVV